MQASETRLQAYIEGTKQYVVPLFQRPYSWEDKHWRNLWADIEQLAALPNARPHFFGSIVAMPTPSVPEGVTKYLLIDGQQRLTTVFILLTVLRAIGLEEGRNELAEEIRNTLLVNPYKTGPDFSKLQPTQADRKAFHALLGTTAEPDAGSKLGRAYRFFERSVRRSKIGIEAIKAIIASRISIVSIVLDANDNPFLVFEGLNAKGMPLTQADLVRNYFIMRVHVSDQDQVYTEVWKPVEDALGPSITDFIRHYLMRKGEEVKQNEIYFALREQVTTENVLSYMGELRRFAGYYRRFLNPADEGNDLVRRGLARLQVLDITICYPFLLNCFELVHANKLKESELADVIALIENFFIRRFIASIPTQGLQRVFAQVSLHIDSDNVLASLARELEKRDYPSDDVLRKRLPTFRLYATGDRLPRARLILESLEESFDHKEPVDLSEVTIEHVMPQTITDAWLQELGEEGRSAHENYLHTLGNLTLTGYNPNLSNASFTKKKEILASSHLELNSYFASCATWTQDEIAKRGALLTERVINIWPDLSESRGFEEQDGVSSGAAGNKSGDTGQQAQQKSDPVLIATKRQQMLLEMERRFGEKLKKAAGRDVLYQGNDGKRRACLVVSKRYAKSDMEYWYAYHGTWDEFLSAGGEAYYVVGCLDRDSAYAIPRNVLAEHLHLLNASEPAGKQKYWHIKLKRNDNGKLALTLPLRGDLLALDPYRIELTPSDSSAVPGPSVVG